MADHERGSDAEVSLKQGFGKWLIPRLPFSEHVFNHFRLELNAIWVRALQYIHPGYRNARSQLRNQKRVKLNIGCGPFGRDGWVNLDLYPAPGVTIRCDCRRRLPLADGSCRGIHCEHFFEHLDHGAERSNFLKECFRCLEEGGILRIVVPDGELFIRAYLSEGWSGFQRIAADGDHPESNFATKMEALNHVFVQGYEHYGAYDSETLINVLCSGGFRKVDKRSFATGSFPDGCIDRARHRPYSLYIEAVK